MLKAIVTFFNILHMALVRVAQALIVGMVIVIAINVFMRFVLDSGLFWGEEVAILFSTWFIFIAMGLGVKQKLHISLHIIPKRFLPRLVDGALDRIDAVVALVVGIVMLVFGFKLVKFTSTSIMPATGWPASTQYMPLILSGILIIYEAVMKIFGVDTRDAEVDAKLSGEALPAAQEERHA
jgi:TRAP-type transport system small permease protein